MRAWIIRFVLVSLVATPAVYLAIALLLIVSQSPSAEVVEEPIAFEAALQADYSSLPTLQAYVARDGTTLVYRLYGDLQQAERMLVLLHGSGWHGMQFHGMAETIARAGATVVVVPDLRGHGSSPVRRGDIDHVGQFEEDVADLISYVRPAGGIPLFLGGHSSGGGLAVRFAGGAHGNMADGFILMAPFLRHDAPTTRQDAGGWARPAIRRIVGLTMLNMVGINFLDHLQVISFPMPASVLQGPLGHTATTHYTHRLMTGFAPRSDFGHDLAAIDRPLLVMAGAADEAFDAHAYEAVIRAHTPTGQYHVIPDATHIGLVSDERAMRIMLNWLDAKSPRRLTN